MPDPKPVTGSHYLRALRWARSACPSGKGTSMAQVVFVQNLIVCSDGRRWHVPHLPIESAQPRTVVSTRGSVDELLLLLEYAGKVNKRRGGGFWVEQEGLLVTVKYAGRIQVHELEAISCGYVPSVFNPPVPGDAPPQAIRTFMDCAGMEAAMSWAHGSGTWAIRGLGGTSDPVRIDLYQGGDLSASAYLMPKGRPSATLPNSDGTLFHGIEAGAERPRGQSILDLQLDLPEPETASCIKIGDTELDTTGLTDEQRKACLKMGPCSHRDDNSPCVVCTSIAISGTRALIAEQADTVIPIDRAKGGKKKGGGKRGPRKKK